MYQLKLHQSDVLQYTRCPRAWWWSSPLGAYLESKVPMAYFTYGRCVHYALGQFYQHNERPVEAMYAWAEAEVRDLARRLGVLPERLAEEYEGLFAEVATVLQHYLLWREHTLADTEIDEWLDFEREFEVPLRPSPGARASCILKYSGRFDGIVRLAGDPRPWVWEVKTARTVKPGQLEYLSHDLQASMYAYACREIYGECAGIYYNFLRKKAPAEPRVLKSGTFSEALDQDTTPYWWAHRAAQLTGDPIELVTSVWGDFLARLEEKHTPFFRRIKITRPLPQVEDAVRTMYEYGKQMRSIARRVTRKQGAQHWALACGALPAAPSWLDCRPKGCQFYIPCLYYMRGAPWYDYLRANFDIRRAWDPTLEREEEA